MGISELLTENVDEILAIATVIPITDALIYLAIKGQVDPVLVLVPLILPILKYYFGRYEGKS